MSGAAQNSREPRHLLQQALKPFAFVDCVATRSNLRSRLCHRVQNGHNLPFFVPDRAVAECEVGVFQVAVAVDRDHEVFDVGRLAIQRLPRDRLQLFPSLMPSDAHWLSQRIGFVAKDRQEAVVVDGEQIRIPEKTRWEIGRHHQVDRDTHRTSPVLHRSQRGQRPVERSQLGAHYTTAGVE